jgi:acetyl-CoA carboxylase, biotin carboxylase subunit
VGIDMSTVGRRFDTVLIANRGEIASRILRACRSVGLRSVVIHSTADRGASYLEEADRAICIGPPPSSQSYLNGDAVILAARLTGAGAIHPGYGFLSENADFARAVEQAGLVFVGPSADAIEQMGDKVAARQAMVAAGVPCVPGSDGTLPDDRERVAAIGERVGFPLLVKAAGGGGGRGMRIVKHAGELAESVAATREEAGRYFNNRNVYLEKFLERPRHIEIQVLCDGHGNAAFLGERDCSMQRRHQKVVEEAPAPGIDRRTVEKIGLLCIAACQRIGYVGAGTFEFLYQDGQFYFIEMNTRLQVEHPVTEMVTGFDIVATQLRIALGQRLGFSQDDIAIDGHAIECRINAEDPITFAPRPGTVAQIDLPEGDGIRVDTHLRAGSVVPPHYDSLVAKLVVRDDTREAALARMRDALESFNVEGIATNVPLHRELMCEPGFVAGGADIHHLEHWLARR